MIDHVLLWTELRPFQNSYVKILILNTTEYECIWRIIKEVN